MERIRPQSPRGRGELLSGRELRPGLLPGGLRRRAGGGGSARGRGEADERGRGEGDDARGPGQAGCDGLPGQRADGAGDVCNTFRAAEAHHVHAVPGVLQDMEAGEGAGVIDGAAMGVRQEKGDSRRRRTAGARGGQRDGNDKLTTLSAFQIKAGMPPKFRKSIPASVHKHDNPLHQLRTQSEKVDCCVTDVGAVDFGEYTHSLWDEKKRGVSVGFTTDDINWGTWGDRDMWPDASSTPLESRQEEFVPGSGRCAYEG